MRQAAQHRSPDKTKAYQRIESNIASQSAIKVGRALEEGNGRGEIALHLKTAGCASKQVVSAAESMIPSMSNVIACKAHSSPIYNAY
jgi:hypothetical protein